MKRGCVGLGAGAGGRPFGGAVCGAWAHEDAVPTSKQEMAAVAFSFSKRLVDFFPEQLRETNIGRLHSSDNTCRSIDKRRFCRLASAKMRTPGRKKTALAPHEYAASLGLVP
jgi:hypothetical protein